MDFGLLAMRRCFQLAQIAGRNTKTNPMVGAVIAHNQKILGEGLHRQFGKSHAEINALNNVSEQDRHLLSHSTLYVSLEPCSHHGKTPPCAEAIVHAGIRKVVIGLQDPSKKVAGRGVTYLKKHGVDVKFSTLTQEAEQLIQPFKAHLGGRPYVILKWAQSYDHFIGKKDASVWISNKYSKFLSHCWRSDVDGILVGKNTVMIDNPRLTTRLVNGKNPCRIILDHNLEIPNNSNVYNDESKTIVFNSQKDDFSKNVSWVKFSPDISEISFVLKTLFKNGIYSLMVEGGSEVLKSFIDAGFWDEARLIVSSNKLHEGISAPQLEGKLLKSYTVANDQIHFVLNPDSKF